MIEAYVTFNEESDAVYVSLQKDDPPSVRTVEVTRPMVFIDFNEDNEIIGIEILGIPNEFIPEDEIPTQED